MLASVWLGIYIDDGINSLHERVWEIRRGMKETKWLYSGISDTTQLTIHCYTPLKYQNGKSQWTKSI